MEPNCSRLCAPPDNPKRPFGGIWLANEIRTHIDSLKDNGTTRDISCLLISDKKDAGKYLEEWIPKGQESERFVKFVEKFPAEWNFKEEFFNKTYIAFVEIAKISKIITDLAPPTIITISPKMKKELTVAENVSDTKSTVLLLGESGTGKELVARYIHDNSPRKDKPFVAINCAAIPENLLESELFGYERGAFTGATCQKKGKFELANNGTIFLDEIGELSPSLQAKLLRVLQEREIERIGSNETIKVNVRVISATNANLGELVETKKFREDLYYRINVVSIHLPLLKERKEDIPLLIDHFLAKYNAEYKRSLKISDTTKQRMMSYNWKGNVRELENFIDSAVAVSKGQDGEQWIAVKIREQSQPQQREDFVLDIPDKGIDANKAVKKYKRELAEIALQKSGGDKTKAQQLLKVSDSTFDRWFKEE